MSGPRVYTVPPGVPFAAAFARGFHRRFAAEPPARRAAARIFVNTARARDAIETALADLAPAPGPLPWLVMIPDLQGDPLLAPDLPPAIEPTRRRLRLTRLVERFLEVKRQAGEQVAPAGAAPDLAAELELLLDQFADADVAASALDEAVGGSDLTDNAAQHWRDMRLFLDIVREAWPAIRAEEEGGALDPRDRQRRVVQALAASWADTPPEAPVLAAATTGSVGSTADLLAAIARLDEGAVVLPALDPETPAETWRAVGPDHPLGPFRGLLDALALAPGDVRLWEAHTPGPRARLLGQALRPAPVTDHWHDAAPALAAELSEATGGLAMIEAETPRHEADAIAVAVREVVAAPAKTVAIVTPDAALARRVTAALARFEIVPDDTMGQPLRLSAPGRLLHLALEAAADPGAPVTLAALLQHPLVSLGHDRGSHLAHARAFERAVLRRTAHDEGLPSWPTEEAHRAGWHAALAATLAPLGAAYGARASLGDLLSAHVAALEALTARPDGPPAIWDQDAGALLQGRLDALAGAAAAFGEGPVADYAKLLGALLADAQLRPKPRTPHPRVAICGTREARLLDADVVIAAGLNDGAWPETPDPGPWLSRPMRVAVGLPLPERSVGLSAHDFLCAASGPEVILTRARKVDGSATVVSRWVIRLQTLLTGVGGEAVWQAIRARGQRHLDRALHLARPALDLPRAARPAAVPPPEARLRSLPVTQLETLVRDAYAVYARYVLDLRPLDPLGRAPDARDRGTALHKIMEAFAAQSTPWPGRAAAAELLARIADEVLAREVAWPDLRRTWRARLARTAPWFLEHEDARRARGEPAAWEVPGTLTLDLPGGPFELTATADRIDRLATGQGAIYDYKTGAPPTKSQMDAGMNHQLHVQAAILAGGGFAGLGPMMAAEGAYIGLTGSGEGGAQTAVPDLAAEVDAHMQQVAALLGAYDAGAPYLSHGRPQFTRFAGDYDHLARVGEWAAEDEA